MATSEVTISKCSFLHNLTIIIILVYIKSRPVVRLIERGVHVKNMQASGHKTYNLMRFKLSTLVLNNLKFDW